MKKEGGDNPKIYLRRRELRAGECEISNQRLPIQNYKNIAALNSRLSGHPPLSPSRDNARRMSVHSHELRIPQPSMFHNRTHPDLRRFQPLRSAPPFHSHSHYLFSLPPPLLQLSNKDLNVHHHHHAVTARMRGYFKNGRSIRHNSALDVTLRGSCLVSPVRCAMMSFDT